MRVAKRRLAVVAFLIIGSLAVSAPAAWQYVTDVRLRGLGASLSYSVPESTFPLPVLLSRKIADVNLCNTDVNDEELAIVNRLPYLSQLSISRTPITAAGILTLTRKESLRVLKIDQCSVGDAGAKAIASRFPLLQSLSASQSDIGTSGVGAILELTDVTALDLSYTMVGDDASAALGDSSVTLLYLRGTKVTDGATPELAKNSAIQVLDLSETRVTDVGVLRLVEKLPNLRDLRLDGTVVSDQLVAILLSKPLLRSVSLNDTDVSKDGKRKLSEKGLLAR